MNHSDGAGTTLIRFLIVLVQGFGVALLGCYIKVHRDTKIASTENNYAI